MRHVVICGAGFGGLEMSTLLSEGFADDVHVTLIDANDSFVFGFSKLEVMFGRQTLDQVRLSYEDITKPNVDFHAERITAIDAQRRIVTTDAGTYEADILVLALGADYAPEATRGLAEGGYEFYSVEGANRVRDVLPTFTSGKAVIGICGPFFKCPPAPFEAAMLLDSYLRDRGVRDDVDISLVSPLPMPIPVAKDTSEQIVRALDDRQISSTFGELVVELDPAAKVARFSSGGSIPYDLFLAIPKHVAPKVVEDSGLCTDGWIAVDQRHLSTRFPNVYAVGDVASAPTPRAGVFAEGQARAAFADIAAKLRGEPEPSAYDGRGTCYIEFGDGLVGKVEADFLSGPEPKAPLVGPTRDIAEEKESFASSRRSRWFGR